MNIIKEKIVIIVVLILSTSLLSYSQCQKKSSGFKFGIKGGMDFTSITHTEVGSISENMNTHTGFNAGVAFSFKLPVKGFTIQPEINYVSKGARIASDDNKLNIRMDYIEVPVNLQIGLDLILLRPFLMVSPYIGYAVNKQWEPQSIQDVFHWDYLNRFEYGLGVGGGVDFWKFQLQVRYNWNFGQLIKSKPEGMIDSITSDIISSIDKGNFRGLDVSLTFFF